MNSSLSSSEYTCTVSSDCTNIPKTGWNNEKNKDFERENSCYNNIAGAYNQADDANRPVLKKVQIAGQAT